MAHDHGLISIGMPVRNCRDTLPTAIRSVRWQTYPRWELLVIDDGSEDGTGDVARHCAGSDERIRVFSDGRHLGTSYRLNQAIALSRGDLFARMDGDDVAYPNRLEVQAEYLRARPLVDLAGAAAVVFRGDGVLLGKRAGAGAHEAICARPYAGVPVMQPTFLGRAAFFREHGYAVDSVRDEDRALFARCFPNGLKQIPGGLRAAEDQDLLMRSYGRSRFGNSPEILLGYREPRLSPVKLLISRYYFMKSIYHNPAAGGPRPWFLWYGAVQAAKLSVDCLAIATGLNYRLLRHRARPVTRGERDRWAEVWAGLRAGPPGGGRGPRRA